MGVCVGGDGNCVFVFVGVCVFDVDGGRIE